MIYKLKIYMVECDTCKVSIRREAGSEFEAIPKDWKRDAQYCGDSYCTGHDTLSCPGCNRKENLKKKIQPAILKSE